MGLSDLLRLFNVFKNFNNLRYSVGIAMLFNGSPIIFFFRDTLHIGPATNIWSAAFFAFGLFLLIPMHLFTRLYKPNFELLKYASGFFVLIIYHFFVFNNSAADPVIEFGNILFSVAFVFLLLHIPNQTINTIIPIIFLFSLFSNFTLVYSLLTDPNWRLGMRAAVTFGNEYAQEGGNPHVPARNALICILSACVLIWQYKSVLIRVFLYFSLFFSLGVLVLTLVRSHLLALGLIIATFLVFNFKLTSMVSFARKIFSWQTIAVFLIVFIGVQLFISRFFDVYSFVYSYGQTGIEKIGNIIYTAFGIKLTENVGIDYSAMGRVSSFYYFSLVLKAPVMLLFGRGYKDVYMDVPILESLINHGIFGFIFFGGFVYYLYINTYKELRWNRNPITIFLAYFNIYFAILLFSAGRPYDISFWFPFALMIRYLGIQYLDPSIEQPKQNEVQLVNH